MHSSKLDETKTDRTGKGSRQIQNYSQVVQQS